MQEEDKRRRLEIREAKLNIWKRWRKATEKKKTETAKKDKPLQEKWLEKLEETIQRINRENEERKLAREILEEKRKKLANENKKKQEEIMIKEEDKKRQEEEKETAGR
jgi:hypothetical protein